MTNNFYEFNKNKIVHWNLDKSSTLLELFKSFENLDVMSKTELCQIMAKHGSDKSVSEKYNKHNYTVIYDYLLKHKRSDTLNLLEVGIGTNYTDVASSMGPDGIPGASLRAWVEYLPNSMIYGVDIDWRILFNDYHIRTKLVDQTDKNSITTMWEWAPSGQIDFMIDDGLHDYKANTTMFENSIQHLKNNGLYIIEDIIINQSNLDLFYDFAAKLSLPTMIVFLHHPHNQIDNVLMIVEKITQ